MFYFYSDVITIVITVSIIATPALSANYKRQAITFQEAEAKDRDSSVGVDDVMTTFQETVYTQVRESMEFNENVENAGVIENRVDKASAEVNRSTKVIGDRKSMLKMEVMDNNGDVENFDDSGSIEIMEDLEDMENVLVKENMEAMENVRVKENIEAMEKLEVDGREIENELIPMIIPGLGKALGKGISNTNCIW